MLLKTGFTEATGGWEEFKSPWLMGWQQAGHVGELSAMQGKEMLFSLNWERYLMACTLWAIAR